ncbi:MAG: LicD family protein [Prevotella sp.]|nr:LicD family protein [Prevotella sp.]
MDHEALRRRFNPDGSQLRRQQERMLELLKVVDDICQRHHIRYWLSSGTLIGAIRHDGFIPWDDDLDIEMLRKDYLKLMEVLPRELPDTMALQTHETDPAYFFCYAKVRDRRSILNEGNNYDRAWKEQGIYIDIFPMEKQRMWVHKLSEKTIGHMYKIWRTSTDDAKALPAVRRIFRLNMRLVYPVLRVLNKLLGAKVITSGLGIPYHNPRYEEDIFPLATHQFEGLSFPVPHDYDHHLRCIYGDYTQLPDLDKVKPHVGKLEFLDEDVKEEL